MAERVVPIGQPLGIDARSGRFQLRSGTQVEELDAQELLAWGALAGVLEDPPQWLSAELAGRRIDELHRGVSPALGPVTGVDYLQRLCERRLAVRVSDDILGIQRFLGAHLFRPNLVGLWASPSDPERRFVGFDDDAVLALPGDVYEVYVEAAAHQTVQDACAAVAMRASTEPQQVAARVAQLRGAFMGTARVVVAIGGGYFDRVAG